MLMKVLIGGIKRAFTKAGGGLLTVTNERNEMDLEGVVALALRAGLVLAVLWFGARHGLDVTALVSYLLAQ